MAIRRSSSMVLGIPGVDRFWEMGAHFSVLPRARRGLATPLCGTVHSIPGVREDFVQERYLFEVVENAVSIFLVFTRSSSPARQCHFTASDCDFDSRNFSMHQSCAFFP